MQKDIEYYTVVEVANILKVSRQMVWKMIKQKTIKASRIGKLWRISNQELKRITG